MVLNDRFEFRVYAAYYTLIFLSFCDKEINLFYKVLHFSFLRGFDVQPNMNMKVMGYIRFFFFFFKKKKRKRRRNKHLAHGYLQRENF